MEVRKGLIGLIGIGVMGGNFVLNVSDHGFPVSVFDATPQKVREFMNEKAGGREITPAFSVSEFANSLHRPRAVMLLVPAGKPVDAVIDEMIPFLEKGDLIIDSGNSHFTDTDRRAAKLAERGLLFMGMGISGGESGARYGPSLMPGGNKEAYERVRPVLEAAAARVNGEPCVAYMGSGSSGHYVKMIHNGIEYGLMQLIAETYDLMRRGLGLSDDDLHAVYAEWNRTELNGYLVQITADIFLQKDEMVPGARLINRILDRAGQKGTGEWASLDAMSLRIPTPNIDVAVMMRNLSDLKAEREAASQVLSGPSKTQPSDSVRLIPQIRDALYAGMIATYAQGMVQLAHASAAYGYNLDLEAVAGIWRGGCIIRAGLLEPIRKAYRSRPDLPNLLMDPHIGGEFSTRQGDLRDVVNAAIDLGIPVPGLMAAIGYFDSYRNARLPANLIQAQRDYFGAHTYERADREGTFHTQWQPN